MTNHSKQNCIINTDVIDRIPAASNCKVISHRGFSHKAPENTLASVAASIAIGTDACEFDVRTTADDRVVLMHDATVDRTTNGTGEISQMTLADAQALDAGSWKGVDYIGQPVPSLDDVFELMAASRQQAVVEIKDPAAAEGIVTCGRKYAMTHRTIALSEDPATLGKIKAANPNITRALLCTAFPKDIKGSAAQTNWLIDQANKASAKVVDIDYRFTSAAMISTLHHAGIKVWVWTVNAAQIMKCLIDWNIDAIASDKPDVLTKTIFSC
jgi:glycerophosphoryl diester phosphodiesterase